MLAPLKPPPIRIPQQVPLPLLITGTAGVPGFNALHYFRERYPGSVVGIRQRDNTNVIGDGVVACDTEDRDELLKLFEKHQFRSVLNAAGVCALKSCELNEELAWRINVAGVQNLLDVIETVYGTTSLAGSQLPRLVHLSVDLVYSGNGYGQYVETDPVDPVTVYGKMMVESERIMTARYPQSCIVRISLPMGISSNGHAGAIDWIQSRFKKHRPATLYYDEFRTPTYTDCMSELCETLLANERLVEPLEGIFHAGGPRSMSLFEIGQVINRVGGYDPNLLMGCPRSHAGPIPPRAGDVSMDSSKLTRALGYEPFDPWPFHEFHAPTDRLWHYRRDDGDLGSPSLLAEVLYRNPGRRSQ